ncbi:MAG: hypothetical protein WC490_02760 [Candidatus Margulisiibacteriota bacterium]
MSAGSNLSVSSNNKHGLSFDPNGGVSAIRTGGNIDISGLALKGVDANSNKENRITQIAHAALGNIGNNVYEIA